MRVGPQKNPLQLRERHEPQVHGVHGACVTERLGPSIRDLGITFRDTAFDGRMHWTLGGAQKTDANGYTFTEPRATCSPAG